MPNSYILLNHTLTPKQAQELKENFNSTNIIMPPQKISDFWQQIPTDAEIGEELLKPVLEWLSVMQNGDILIIQGEFGATFALVGLALEKGVKVLHSVTERIATESRNGELVERNYVFEHKRFREYKKIVYSAIED